MTSSAVPDPPIDPFASTRGGVYSDAHVEVRAMGAGGAGPRPLPRPRRELRMVRTAHFDLTPIGDRIRLWHYLDATELDDDLSGLLAEELFVPGWLRGQELFERIFTGVVRSLRAEPWDSWELFYRNTLARIEQTLSGASTAASTEPRSGHGTIADYAPVYARAESMVEGDSALELGCCFGFLSLRIAAAGRHTVASDVSAGTVGLLADIAPRLGLDVATQMADAARFPGPDRSVDTVLAVHLLEHLEPDHGDRVVSEAVRLAARRVVVAVPLEDEADETWGHVRTVSLADLEAWGRASGLAHTVFEHHGGWLVLDRLR